MKTATVQKTAVLWGLLLVLSLLIVPLASAQGPVLQGGNPKFNGTAAEEEGYWYSRYNLGNLVMRSGMGDTFMPEMEMVQKMMQMADANPDDGDTPAPPKNPALLRSVYASGDPHYIQTLDVSDFGTQRWDPASFDTTVTSQALGWTMIKESEWAKQFHVDNHFGTPADNFGAQWRFVGLVLNAEAKMQGQFALQNLKNDQGLIANSDGTVDWPGQWVMLTAFSDLGSTLGASTLPHSVANRYNDPQASGLFLGAADGLFGALASRQPADTAELSLAVQGLTWYAATTTNAEHQAQAIERIGQFGDALLGASTDNATNAAYVIRGLVEAYRVTGDSKYLDGAAAAFNALSADYDATHGVFNSQSNYTIDNVAVIMGALNSLKLFGGGAVDANQVESLFAGFFESAVNLSGLQISAPPIPVAKGAFEQNEPPIFYAYPGMPFPPMAGGEFGVAPVFATEVKWDGSQWSVVNGRFDAAGAMHASNEFIWFHNDEVNGFPQVTALPADAAAPAALPETGGASSPSASNLPLLAALAGLLLIGGGVTLRRFAGSGVKERAE